MDPRLKHSGVTGKWIPAFAGMTIGCFITFLLSPSTLAAKSASKREVAIVERTEEGVKVKDGTYLDIPEDRIVKRVGKNVIAPESGTEYLRRKIEQVETRVATFEKSMTERLDRIEKQLQEIHQSITHPQT